MSSDQVQVRPGHKRFATVCAILGWFGLAVQLYLILLGRWEIQASPIGGLVKFFSFFTVLTNTLVAVALSCAVVNRQSAGHRFFRSPIVCSGITVSIVLVGIAYNLLLRHLWHPEGWQLVADELLHDIMPLAFLAYWWLYVRKGVLRLKHVCVWTVYPLVYFAYVLLRGDLIGDYVYPFIDIGTIGYFSAFTNALGVLAGFVAMGLLLLGVDRLRAPRPV
ncbi:Pr6Pr family membrane protein [Pseudomonas huanghezhanensis]|uniref:Pr6Pr family membrane protein n=1 Tax=Pseudomonas huanghezhanensis TaxID=3002903 RepID=UPI0022865F75|nr:Pr6Pr family membrane protein [Pseudomonas sp. BSw22131]